MLDTLNLLCKVTGIQVYYVTFVIHKGQAPTGMQATGSPPLLTVQISGGGTLIYSDETGPQAGYENVIVITPGGSQFFASYAWATYFFRLVNIATLRPTDSGTYHCSGMFQDGLASNSFLSSGGLTITVNTKPGQAGSSRAYQNNILTYSAALLGASKLLL